MQELEHFYRQADLFPEAILLVDTEGVILAANPAAKRQLAAYAIDAGKTSLPEICSESREQIHAYLRACGRTRSLVPATLTFTASGNVATEFRSEGALYAPKAAGSLPQLLLRLAPKQEGISRFVALNQQVEQLSREVERRRRIELQLVEQRERLRVTLASIGDAVIATDVNAIITFLNPVAEVQTGWLNHEAIGKPLVEVFRIINEETRQVVENPVERVIREGVIVGLANHTVLVRKDGTELPIDDSGAPIRDADGAVIGAVLVFHDISERRRLEQQVEARTLELEDEHRRKDEFLAMLGHELRNPLAPIKAALQLQALPRSSEEVQKRAREIMNRQVDHLTRLVDELLDVARISTGKINLKNELLEAASIIYRAAELCEPMIREKEQTLAIELPPEQLHLRGDLQRLTQVVGNLLNNAAKYTQRGGAIRLSVSKNGDHIEIVVRDNGMGIHPSVLPRIFDVFSQSERTLARAEGGLGVGLTLVRRLVEQHGGSVAAFSEGQDQGSEFRISLPIAAAPAVAELPASSSVPAASPERKVLVVDDNPDAATMLGEVLRLLGNDVVIASNGTEAIASALRSRPAAIFLDIGLPGMDGYAVAKSLRAQPETAKIILVAVTGYGQSDDMRKTREAGFDHHLVKPADMDKIRDILASLPAQ